MMGTEISIRNEYGTDFCSWCSSVIDLRNPRRLLGKVYNNKLARRWEAVKRSDLLKKDVTKDSTS